MERRHYFDNAAATPLDKRVFRAMLPFLKTAYGNPSSIHAEGVAARTAIDAARKRVATAIAGHEDEIVFTSGATESINLAIQGVLKQKLGHVVTLATEHKAVLSSLDADVTIVPVASDGTASVDEVIAAIRPDTVLVSVMLANNEIGTVHPVAEIGREIERRRKASGSAYPLLHTDATQAANYLDLDVARLHVDLMSLAGSKISGPKGTGMLFVRRGVLLAPIIVGGKQEGRLRAGTENVAGIVGFAEALQLAAASRDAEVRRIGKLRSKLVRGLKKALPDIAFNGVSSSTLPNIVNFSIPGIDGEELVIRLDARGIAASTASACKGGSGMSHVLRALGLSDERVLGSVRLSLGRQTRGRDIAAVIKTLPELVAQMR